MRHRRLKGYFCASSADGYVILGRYFVFSGIACIVVYEHLHTETYCYY